MTGLQGRKHDDLRRMEDQIGRLLVEGGFLSREQLDEARAHARRHDATLRSAIVALRFLADETYSTFLSMQVRAPLADLDQITVQPEALALVPYDIARRHAALPLAVDGGTIRVAMDHPQDADALEALAQATGLRVRPMLPARGVVEPYIETHYTAIAPEAVHPAPASEGVEQVIDRVLDETPASSGALLTPRIEGELTDCRRRLAETPDERRRLAEGYARGVVPDDLMRARLAEIEREETVLRTRIAELEYRLSRLALTREQDDVLDTFLAQARGWLDHLTAEEGEAVTAQILDRLAHGLATPSRAVPPKAEREAVQRRTTVSPQPASRVA